MLSLILLCTISYLLGSYHPNTQPSSLFPTKLSSSCFTSASNSTNPLPVPLDFSSHHSLSSSARVPHFPPCSLNSSEYTPCHDVERSLRFPRTRLIYRERHCPLEEGEFLRCRVPAPHGYTTPFRWPESRDMVWYANVPHKWLTVEKAGQNWVRFEGDRFTFPGGGTMFPHGADAYIDEIGKIINLKDGSVRTAIDTGCGVSI